MPLLLPSLPFSSTEFLAKEKLALKPLIHRTLPVSLSGALILGVLASKNMKYGGPLTEEESLEYG